MVTRRRLPFRITLLLTLVLITTVASAIRLLTAIAWRGTLGLYVWPPEIVYIGVTGAAWTLVGLFLFWSFWRGVRRIREIFLGASIAYAAWVWADRLLVQETPRANWAFDLVVTILLLAYVAAVVLDPRNLSYFRKETHERKPEEPRTA